MSCAKLKNEIICSKGWRLLNLDAIIDLILQLTPQRVRIINSYGLSGEAADAILQMQLRDCLEAEKFGRNTLYKRRLLTYRISYGASILEIGRKRNPAENNLRNAATDSN